MQKVLTIFPVLTAPKNVCMRRDCAERQPLSYQVLFWLSTMTMARLLTLLLLAFIVGGTTSAIVFADQRQPYPSLQKHEIVLEIQETRLDNLETKMKDQEHLTTRLENENFMLKGALGSFGGLLLVLNLYMAFGKVRQQQGGAGNQDKG